MHCVVQTEPRTLTENVIAKCVGCFKASFLSNMYRISM